MVLEIGKYANLRIVKEVDFGMYLDGGPFGEILLPLREVPEGAKPEDVIKVFVYVDSEDRLITTTITPKTEVGKFAYLKAVSVDEFGAFLDWGIPTKDLFVPFKEQRIKMQAGYSYLVYTYLDEETDRIAASSKIGRFVEEGDHDFYVGQRVNVLIAQRTDLGYKAIIEGKNWGVIYQNEVFKPIKIGEEHQVYIKKIRPDGKIDLSLQAQGYVAAIGPASAKIMEKLDENDGFLPLTDKSPPALIYDVFEMSKKMFKKSVGNLYKLKMIRIEKDGIYKK